jgi:transcriptional regulator with XRE-family HTH domain
MTTLHARIRELAKAHGSLRRLADAIEVDAGYLSRLRDGDKSNPSDELLRKLGLRRMVSYVLVSNNT